MKASSLEETLRQRRQHIRVTILPPNIFSTEVELGPGGSSDGDSELDFLSFWQILVPVFSSSCSLEQGAESPHTHGPFPLPWPDSCRLPDLAGRTLRLMHRQESAQGIYIQVPNGIRALTSQARALYVYCIQAHKPATGVCAHPYPKTCDAHTRAHSGEHSTVVYMHNTPRSRFRSASPKLPSHIPGPKHRPFRRAMQHGGAGSPRPSPPYRSSRYFRYSEQSCWAPGLNQGVQDADRKLSGEMAGRWDQGKERQGQDSRLLTNLAHSMLGTLFPPPPGLLTEGLPS